MKTKYKVGDIVLIRDDLRINAFYSMEYDTEGGYCPSVSMLTYIGKFAKIESICNDGDCYKLDVDNQKCFWTDDMFVNLDGTFGETTDTRDLFVIVNQTMVFQNGYYDRLSNYYKTKPHSGESNIGKLVSGCKSFRHYVNGIQSNEFKVLYKFKKPVKYTYEELKRFVGHDFELVD